MMVQILQKTPELGTNDAMYISVIQQIASAKIETLES